MRSANAVSRWLDIFRKQAGYNVVRFSDINRQFLQQFETFLQEDAGEYKYNGHKYSKKRYSSGYQKKHFDLIRQVAKYYRSDLNVNADIFDYSITENSREKRVLDYEEIEAFVNVNTLNKREELAQDIFAFMCFSGMRIGATQDLRVSDIYGGFINWVNTKPKNTKMINTSIHRFNAKIIRKYKKDNDRELFPYMPQQYLNEHIKQIAERASIRSPRELTCHTGRHSYNSLLYKLGFDTFIRCEELGHSHSTTNEQTYTKLDKDERKTLIVEAFNRLEEILDNKKTLVTREFDNI